MNIAIQSAKLSTFKRIMSDSFVSKGILIRLAGTGLWKIYSLIPSMHPCCRCSISAYMDRQEFDQWLDFLDKGGTTEEWNKLKNERSFATIHLTDDERYALNEYKSFRGFVINERLRKVGKDKLPKEDKAIVNYLDSFLRKMPKYEGNLSRSLFFEDDKELNKFLGEHKIGKTVSYAAYTSTRKRLAYITKKDRYRSL